MISDRGHRAASGHRPRLELESPFLSEEKQQSVTSEHRGPLRDVLVALFAWGVIAAAIVTAGISPMLAALAASVVAVDVAYYRRLDRADSTASRS